MQSEATSPEEYIERLANDRKELMQQLHKLIKRNLPTGCEEIISYGMIGYVIPHKLYPSGSLLKTTKQALNKNKNAFTS